MLPVLDGTHSDWRMEKTGFFLDALDFASSRTFCHSRNLSSLSLDLGFNTALPNTALPCCFMGDPLLSTAQSKGLIISTGCS